MVVEGNDGNMVHGCFETSDTVVPGSFSVRGTCLQESCVGDFWHWFFALVFGSDFWPGRYYIWSQ